MELPPIDIESFAKELEEIQAQELEIIGKGDIHHVRNIDYLTRALFFIGVAGSVWFINPISAFLISLAKTARWTIIAHHVSHRGFDRIENVPKRYSSNYFVPFFD